MNAKILNKSWIVIKTFPFKKNVLINPKRYQSTASNAGEAASKNETEYRTTIDKPNVDKFTEILNEWWDPTGPTIGLHAMNLVRVPLIRDGLVSCLPNERTVKPLKNKKILDVGCGGGILSEALSRIGAEVTGIDANQDLVKLAEYHSKTNNKLPIKPKYCYTTIEDHSKEVPNYYDAVVASEVIEHIVDKELFVKSCTDALKPGGRIFFTTPTRSRLSKVFGIWTAEYLFGCLPTGTHQYELLMTPTELTFLLERNNCHVELIHGLMYNPILRKWSFSNTQQLLFALQAVKLK